MNDMELSRKRKEDILENGIPKGFPVHFLLIVGDKYEVRAFFTKKALERATNQLPREVDYIYKLVYVKDVKHVKFEC